MLFSLVVQLIDKPQESKYPAKVNDFTVNLMGHIKTITILLTLNT